MSCTRTSLRPQQSHSLSDLRGLGHTKPQPDGVDLPSESHPPARAPNPLDVTHTTSPAYFPSKDSLCALAPSPTIVRITSSFRISHIHTLLQRCQVLHATLTSLSQTSHATHRVQQYATRLHVLALRASRLAEGIRDIGLQARSSLWIAVVLNEEGDEMGAMAALGTAIMLDRAARQEGEDGSEETGWMQQSMGLNSKTKTGLRDKERRLACSIMECVEYQTKRREESVQSTGLRVSPTNTHIPSYVSSYRRSQNLMYTP